MGRWEWEGRAGQELGLNQPVQPDQASRTHLQNEAICTKSRGSFVSTAWALKQLKQPKQLQQHPS